MNMENTISISISEYRELITCQICLRMILTGRHEYDYTDDAVLKMVKAINVPAVVLPSKSPESEGAPDA